MTRQSNEQADAKAKLIVSRFTENAIYWEGPRATSKITSVDHLSTISKARTPR
jgi:hypothetical protein